jgi:LysR family transcriptional regulator, hydrogen peroxide-inducible genes activator
MTLTELKYVVAVARERHFGRAAASCFVTQPTLSVGIRKLEEELGLQLFERGPSEVVVTPAGEAIVEQARRVLEEAARLKSLAERNSDQLSGPLRVGAIFTAGPYLVPHIIPKLKRQAPDMPLVIEENFTARLADRLRDGELDVIIVAQPFSAPGIVTWPLFEEPFVLLLPVGHRWQQRADIRLDEVSGEHLLLLGPGHCLRDQVLAACPDCAEPGGEQGLQGAVQGSSLETIRAMVASGLGVTVVPVTSTSLDAAPQRRLFTVKPFNDANPPARVMTLAWRRGFPRPQAIEALRRAILESHLKGVRYLDFEPASGD